MEQNRAFVLGCFLEALTDEEFEWFYRETKEEVRRHTGRFEQMVRVFTTTGGNCIFTIKEIEEEYEWLKDVGARQSRFACQDGRKSQSRS
jgi:hypothetical protein